MAPTTAKMIECVECNKHNKQQYKDDAAAAVVPCPCFAEERVTREDVPSSAWALGTTVPGGSVAFWPSAAIVRFHCPQCAAGVVVCPVCHTPSWKQQQKQLKQQQKEQLQPSLNTCSACGMLLLPDWVERKLGLTGAHVHCEEDAFVLQRRWFGSAYLKQKRQELRRLFALAQQAKQQQAKQQQDAATSEPQTKRAKRSGGDIQHDAQHQHSARDAERRMVAVRWAMHRGEEQLQEPEGGALSTTDALVVAVVNLEGAGVLASSRHRALVERVLHHAACGRGLQQLRARIHRLVAAAKAAKNHGCPLAAHVLSSRARVFAHILEAAACNASVNDTTATTTSSSSSSMLSSSSSSAASPARVAHAKKKKKTSAKGVNATDRHDHSHSNAVHAQASHVTQGSNLQHQHKQEQGDGGGCDNGRDCDDGDGEGESASQAPHLNGSSSSPVQSRSLPCSQRVAAMLSSPPPKFPVITGHAAAAADAHVYGVHTTAVPLVPALKTHATTTATTTTTTTTTTAATTAAMVTAAGATEATAPAIMATATGGTMMTLQPGQQPVQQQAHHAPSSSSSSSSSTSLPSSSSSLSVSIATPATQALLGDVVAWAGSLAHACMTAVAQAEGNAANASWLLSASASSSSSTSSSSSSGGQHGGGDSTITVGGTSANSSRNSNCNGTGTRGGRDADKSHPVRMDDSRDDDDDNEHDDENNDCDDDDDDDENDDDCDDDGDNANGGGESSDLAMPSNMGVHDDDDDEGEGDDRGVPASTTAHGHSAVNGSTNGSVKTPTACNGAPMSTVDALVSQRSRHGVERLGERLSFLRSTQQQRLAYVNALAVARWLWTATHMQSGQPH
ncbi:hypothetical protein PTSG_06004 [Salpingoeca rosetta]|uniref:Uncharacterized protein n=1 Tax=Salpingoeca rosetta (strain ATCC 50818 / BSB-021) TaxID=946362 RepID=F2UDE4_SALR5|nr:uncharacterized protein PTSG_06004 [Salpingoeca rosetta]EGD74639.1 hypothetical protein PTSG_06004 [Salpingoeca rosetta]|eukprot:XP_004992896.1 hypothetical protein PTSG_06004 [Salpingoeca rosetta]